MMGDWQPIETAPKDGTRILGAINGEVLIIGWILPIDAWGPIDDGGFGLPSWSDGEIEGWMPLPEPPKP
jgi:hypothetical protein